MTPDLFTTSAPLTFPLKQISTPCFSPNHRIYHHGENLLQLACFVILFELLPQIKIQRGILIQIIMSRFRFNYKITFKLTSYINSPKKGGKKTPKSSGSVALWIRGDLFKYYTAFKCISYTDLTDFKVPRDKFVISGNKNTTQKLKSRTVAGF